ncbi:MAG: hypothetical protein HQM11_18435 [SAR324 cluster bacterium]|nr:hypothetical protein [SAR324 cluster bacterium]
MDSAKQEVFGDKIPTFVLAPNNWHHMGINPWLEVFPDMKIVADQQAIPRLTRKAITNIQSLDVLKPLLPSSMHLLIPEACNLGEVWLSFKTSAGTNWVVCDAFFNISQTPKKLLPKLIMTVFKSGPGLSMSTLMVLFGFSNRKQFKKWVLDQIDKEHPKGLIPAHGDNIFDPDLPERLRNIVQERL